MPTPPKGPRLGGGPAHERLMLANLATSLFEHGRITTTEAKAKRLRPYAEKLVTFGKRGDLHARRQVLKVLRDKSVVHTLFAEIGPRYENRPGGYTRIVKLGPRKGDNAPMALIELVEALTVAQQAVGEAERARGTQVAPARPVTAATAEAAADLTTESPTAAAVDAEVRGQVEDGVTDESGSPVETGDPGQGDAGEGEPGGTTTPDSPADVPGGVGTPAETEVDEAEGSQPGPDEDAK